MSSYDKVRETSFFQAFRDEGYPSVYAEQRISADTDLKLIWILTIFIGISITFLFVLPGFKGKERWYVLIRATISLFIGFAIILCNFENCWRKGSVIVKAPYKVGYPPSVIAEIRLNLGLRGFNVTFKQIEYEFLDARHDDTNVNEKKIMPLNYNEFFSWEWNQGRVGFGPQAGKIQQEYIKAMTRGLPLPILRVAEYFIYDGEGISYGRYFRLAGWYTHFFLWFAFALWLLTNLFFHMVIQYGAMTLTLTGNILILANILYSNIHNSIPLAIPFEAPDHIEPVWLKPTYAWCYYLNMVNGIICIFFGVLAFFCDLQYPDETAEFFGISVLQSYDDFYADADEGDKNSLRSASSEEMIRNTGHVGLKKRAPFTSRLSRLQRNTLKRPNSAMVKQKITVTDMSTMQEKNGPKETKNNNNESIIEMPVIRKKVHPDVPVFQNFIRESFAPVQEESESSINDSTN